MDSGRASPPHRRTLYPAVQLAHIRAMLSRRHFLIASAAAGLDAGRAYAQSYPTRPIKMLVPFPAGGPVDVMGRLVAQSLSAALGQQVVIDNHPGAGATLAGRIVANAEPDGYTLLMGSPGTLAIGPALYRNIGYTVEKSFAPIAMVSSVPYVMITGPKGPAATLPQLVAYAKANPGKLNFGVPNGAAPHMMAAWFRDVTGTDIVIVPYKGAATVITDLMGGQIDLAFETTSVLFEHLRAGTVRGLGVTTMARLPDIPDVPTMIEGGAPDFVAGSWTGVLAPAGTPKEIIGRLNASINAGLRSPVMQDRFKQIAAQARPGSPEDFAAFISKEAPRWAAMVKLSGVEPD
jgi:tripartite-type tricarboxylate transporter receptor subunit TctC